MKKIITSFLMAILAIGAWAQDTTEPVTTPEVVFDFINDDNFKACTVTNSPSSASLSFSSSSGVNIYAYVKSPSNYTSYDYEIVSPEKELEGHNQYAVYLTPSIYSGWDGKKSYQLKVLFGQGDDLDQFDALGTCEVYESSYNGVHQEFTFGVENTGNYKIAIQISGKGVTPKIAELQLVKIGATQVPLAVSDFTIVPDAEGKSEATISFTLPSKTESYDDLENISYTVSRIVLNAETENEAVTIKDHVEGTPGEEIEFVDEVPVNNTTYSYTVFVTNGGEVSKSATTAAYVGLDTPTVPANFELSEIEESFVLSWDVPTVGINGISLSPEKLIYSLTRILDGEETIIEENLSNVATYTDDFTFTGLHNLQYSIKAKYTADGQFSEEGVTRLVNIGYVSLPYSYSFAGGVLDPSWESVIIKPLNSTYESYKWQAKEKENKLFIANIQGQRIEVDVLPFDEDGGLAFYSYNTSGNSSRLISPSIQYTAGQNPVLSFARFVNISDSKDVIKIQISKDGGEWEDIPEALYYNGSADENKWVEESVELSEAITQGTSKYRIAFLAEAAGGKAMFIDAVRLFNVIDKDLSIDAFTVSEKAHAGDKLSIMVKVANNGTAEVAADAYSVEIEHDFTDDIVLGDLQAIPSLSSVTYEVSVPVHSLHLYQVEGFEFTAKVNFEDDGDLSNNESETQVVEASYSAGNGTQITKSTYDKDGNYYLYWEPAFDPEYTPVNIVESFEDSDNYDYDRKNETYYGPFNGWVTIDRDMAKGAFWYSVGTSQFSLCENVSTPGSTKDGNNVIGATLQKGAEQDDWIISPEINCKEGSTMDLSFLFGVKQNTSSGMAYELEILYTTDEEYSMEDPISNFTHQVATGKYDYTSYAGAPVKHDNKMYPLTFTGIPAEAKYVAIHFITSKPSYDMAMWVDKIELVEHDENPFLGYHVYSLEVGGRLNEEIIGADKTEFKFKPQAAEETEAPQPAKHRAASLATGEPMLFVSAVYADGEAKAKNVWNYADQSVTGIENVAVDSAEGVAEYYNLQGMKVSGDKLTPGIYIIRTGKTSQKVMVK